MLVVVAVVLASLQSPPSTVGDSAVQLNGFVQQGDSNVAELILAYPLTVAGDSGKRMRLGSLRFAGDPKRWTRLSDRYVSALGRVTWPALLEAQDVRPIPPPGEVNRDVRPSFSEHSVVTLAIVPNRIAWRDAAGRPSGVAPVAYYTVFNHGDAPLQFMFNSNEVLCIEVEREGYARWRDSWRPPRINERLHVEMGSVVRYLAPLPERAAPTAGHYTAHVSLCGVPDYEVAVDFEVVAP